MGEIVTVNFRGDELYGFKQEDGVYLALKPMVEAMGLNWEGQRQRLNRDPILSEGTCVMQVPFGRGGPQDVTCLKMDLVNGWLFTIDSSRIKDDEVRKRVQLYQRECYGVLYAHFTGKAVITDQEPDSALPIGERRKLVTEARQSFGTHTSRQLWFKLGLPLVPAMSLAEGSEEPFLPGMDHPANDVKTVKAA